MAGDPRVETTTRTILHPRRAKRVPDGGGRQRCPALMRAAPAPHYGAGFVEIDSKMRALVLCMNKKIHILEMYWVIKKQIY